MSWADPFWWPHTVAIRSLLTGGGMGSSFAVSRNAAAEVRDEQRLVRNRDGAEVVSSTQVTVALTESVPVGSMVTVWPGTSGQREAEVLAVGRDENGDSGLDSFQVLSLT